MFRGATSINLDSKGRLAIPTRYRTSLIEECEGCFVCTVDVFQPCLLLYPLPAWKNIEQMLLGLSTFDPNQRRIQRVMLGFASECEMDKAGRILLSPVLRQHAQLEQQIMFVGQLNKFEIWQEQQWRNQIHEDLSITTSQDFSHCNELKHLSF